VDLEVVDLEVVYLEVVDLQDLEVRDCGSRGIFPFFSLSIWEPCCLASIRVRNCDAVGTEVCIYFP